MSKQQKLILEIIQQSDQHLNAEQVFMKAKQKLPSIAMGTVYRNLSKLAQLGSIRKVEVHGSADQYDKNTLPHDHLLCEMCGRLTDIKITGLKQYLESSIQLPIDSFDLCIRCVCVNCQKSHA